MYKRKPKLDCRIKNKHQDHDDEKYEDKDESDDVDNDDQEELLSESSIL